MDDFIKVTASDGHILDVYLAQAQGSPKGGIVLIQEIFGINSHMKSVADQYASEGYLVGAPSLFDRVESNIRLCYYSDDVVHGKELKESVELGEMLIELSLATFKGFKSKHDDQIDNISMLGEFNAWKPSEVSSGESGDGTMMWDDEEPEAEGSSSYFV